MRTEGSILLVGVGGQGVLLASHILATVCLRAGFDVKKSEVHGMAQRGGIVFSHVRYGRRVHSPVIEEGSSDALVAMEWAEAIRWVSYVKPLGTVVTSSTQIVPPAACTDRRRWTSAYPAIRTTVFGERRLYCTDAQAVAKAAGAAKAANTVLLGALSTSLGFAVELWEAAIRDTVPTSAVEGNLKAFAAGRNLAPWRPDGRSGSPTAAAPAPGSTVPGRAQMYAVDVVEAWCKGCDICVRICPEDCLRLDAAGIARLVDGQACTGCRLCEQLCPDFAIAVRPVEVAAHG